MVLDEDLEEEGGNGYRPMPAPDEAGMRAICALPALDQPTIDGPDMEYVLHPEEIEDLEWRRVSLPIESLFPSERLDDARKLPGEDPVAARRRWTSLRVWMTREGGAEAAIRKSPIIAMIDGPHISVLDGWHRCVVAKRDYGLTHISVILGISPVLVAEYQPAASSSPECDISP